MAEKARVSCPACKTGDRSCPWCLGAGNVASEIAENFRSRPARLEGFAEAILNWSPVWRVTWAEYLEAFRSIHPGKLYQQFYLTGGGYIRAKAREDERRQKRMSTI